MDKKPPTWTDWWDIRHLPHEDLPDLSVIPSTPMALRSWLKKNLSKEQLERIQQHLMEKNLSEDCNPEEWLTVAREAVEELSYSDKEMYQALDRLFVSSLPSTPLSTVIMNWFLRFTDLNLGSLSRGDWLNLKYEIMVLDSKDTKARQDAFWVLGRSGWELVAAIPGDYHTGELTAPKVTLFLKREATHDIDF